MERMADLQALLAQEQAKLERAEVYRKDLERQQRAEFFKAREYRKRIAAINTSIALLEKRQKQAETMQ